MKPETFFDNFEMLADAPNGVKKLREMILQLAVQGNLVAQDERDEPASVLLERIIVERKKLVKEGKIKENGKFSIENEDVPFELPSIWKWTCLYEIGIINPRNIAEDDKEVSFIPMTLISETSITPIGSEKRRWGEVKKGFTHFAEDDIVLAKITPCFQNGKSAVMRGLINNLGAGTTELHVFRPILNESVNPEYVLLYLRSPQFLSEGIEKMTGTAGQKRVPKDYFAGNPFPLPPFEEQHRIVAKVNQLMSLCDELEARQQKKRESRAHLNSAALDRLLAARAPEEFAQGWRRISDNFDLLYDAPENVGALRQAILQLAVMGKLVRQDPNDEPASVLAEKVKTEKERLIKEKKINNARALPTIDEDKIPYNLPEGWKWIRLGDVCHDWGQKKPDVEFTYIDVSAIDKEHGIISEDVKILKPNEAPSRARKIVSKGTVIYATVRPYLLNIAIVDKEIEPEPIVSTAFAVLHPLSGVLNRYLYYYLRSKPFITYVESEMTGMAYPAINDGKLYLGLVPLPHSNEQRRIVARVDQLMSLCDELEAGLMRSQADGERLMEAVVGRMLAGE